MGEETNTRTDRSGRRSNRDWLANSASAYANCSTPEESNENGDRSAWRINRQLIRSSALDAVRFYWPLAKYLGGNHTDNLADQFHHPLAALHSGQAETLPFARVLGKHNNLRQCFALHELFS